MTEGSKKNIPAPTRVTALHKTRMNRSHGGAGADLLLKRKTIETTDAETQPLTTWDSAFQEAKSHARDYRAAGVKERETNGAQLTSHGSYLQLPRIFKDCKESLFHFSNKENTPRNKQAAMHRTGRREQGHPGAHALGDSA